MDPAVLMSMMNDKDNGFMGSEFIWIILFFFLFGFGGNGFGGRGANDLAGLTDAVKAANSDQTQTGFLFSAIEGNGKAIAQLSDYLGVSTASLKDAISGLSNGVCDLGYKMGMDTRDVLQAVANGNARLSTELATCCCETNRNIDSVRYDVTRSVDGVSYQLASAQGNIINAIDKCCCETQIGIKDLGYQGATQTATIMNAMDRGFCDVNTNISNQITALSYQQQQGFQSVINHLNNQETDRLRTELQASQLQLSQQAQTANIEAYIRESVGTVIRHQVPPYYPPVTTP